VDNAQVVFIAVPTPQQATAMVDLSFLEKVAREIAGVLDQIIGSIVDKSTGAGENGRKSG
jgi:UDPglucose 6-dehydrogenase